MVIRLRVSRRVGKIGKKFARELRAESISQRLLVYRLTGLSPVSLNKYSTFNLIKSVYNSYSRCQHQLIYFEQIMENSRISGYPEDY
jgi:hypothetical protein